MYATWKLMQRPGVQVTHLMWNFMDLVDGHQLQLTNPDKSRTFASIYMHENKLYIMEGTVPDGYPEPGLFQQSLGWLDESRQRDSLPGDLSPRRSASSGQRSRRASGRRAHQCAGCAAGAGGRAARRTSAMSVDSK